MNIKNIYKKLTSYATEPQKVFYFALASAAISTVCYTLFLTDVYRDTTHVYAP